MTAATPRPRLRLPSRDTVAVTIATLAALAVAGAAFARSFSALSDLATMHDWPADQAWILPIALDGMIVVPTVAAVVRRHARWYAWSLLVAGTVLSVAGNGIHAWLTTQSHIAVGLAVIPPLVTLAAVHLTIALARQDDTTATPEPATGEQIRLQRDAESEHDAPTPTPRPVTRLHVAPPVATRDTNVEQATLDLDVAPTAAQSADALRDEALRLVAAGLSVRAAGEQLGISKDKVWRWVRQARPTTGDTAVVAG